jgi:hypothetical protein
MHKELKAIDRELRKQGFDTWIQKNGHMAVYLDGRRVTVFSSTPSDFRSWKNSLAACKRAGFIWPAPRE